MAYAENTVKNLLIAGHAGTGKTSLLEALLFHTGAVDRQGRVEDGNTVSDFDPEEAKRQASLSSTVAPVTYKDMKFNFVDAPGLFDFELGVHEGFLAAETVLLMVSARDGLQVGTEKAYKMATKLGKGHMIYVSKLDAENADFYKVFEELKTRFGPSVCPIVVPVQEGANTVYVNLMDMKSYTYEKGKATPVSTPDTGHRIDGLIAAMSEAVAETDEELMEKFFSGEKFSAEELRKGIHAGILSGAITPVLCGAATKLEAMDLLLDSIYHLLPTAGQRGAMQGKNIQGEVVEIPCTSAGPLAAYVFKTVADPFVGKLSFVKVVRGTLKSDSPLVNSRTEESERMGKLLFVRGKKQTDTGEIGAGDIGVITKLSETKTGDMLCAPGNLVKMDTLSLPRPSLSMAMSVKQKGDEGKISSAMQRLMEEDGTISYRTDTETLQQILSGLGEQHLDSVVSKLKAKFGVGVELVAPRVPYRETIRKKVKAEGKHKKQTGGHGQYGHVVIEFEPTEGEEMVFAENVFGGSVPRSFFPAVEKGLQNSVKRGVVAGYPMVGIKATLLDGSYHPVDSSEMAFKTAASLAYKNGLSQASPVLLEPIGVLKANVPDSNTGDVMGEVNKRRGRILGMTPSEEGGYQVVEAEVPMSEMHDFSTFIRSLTQGRGNFDFDFVRYDPLPQQLEGKVVAEAKGFFGQEKEEEE